MYCTECGTKNDESSQFCINCGKKLQKELINNRIRKENISINKKKSNKALFIILGIIGGMVLLGIIIFVALLVIGINYIKEDWLTGTYSCGPIQNITETNTTMNFIVKKDKTFIMSYGRDIVSGKYEITNVDYDGDKNSKKYELKLTANNRYLNGTLYTDDYSTDYELVIDENDEAVLMNTKSMQIYYCKKNMKYNE